MIDMCIATSLKIANGRVLGDPNGKFTCHKYNGSSVIEYVLVGSSVLSEVRYLRVWRP